MKEVYRPRSGWLRQPLAVLSQCSLPLLFLLVSCRKVESAPTTAAPLDEARAADVDDSGREEAQTHSVSKDQFRDASTREGGQDLAGADSPVYDIVRIVDGDTIVVRARTSEVTVRLIGVDTPETVRPHEPVEYFGKEASDFLRDLLGSERVVLRYDDGIASLDKYGRTLAYVYRTSDGLLVNQEIIRQGFGHAYTKYPFGKMAEFRETERFARDSGRGLWRERGRSLLSQLHGGTGLDEKPKEPPGHAEDPIVYITETGTHYHCASCTYLSKSKIPIRLSLVRGSHVACSQCKPPP